MKQLVWLGLFVGSTIGSLIPELWGAGVFSTSSLLLGAVGGIAGIYVAYKFAQGEL
ncbi:MAG: hypothetical protein ABSB00_00905 [Minisyncoccia bacterium]|jgi:hypothetical protein